MKILFVFNNCKWFSIDSKLSDLKKWFEPLGDFRMDIKHTSFDSIPFAIYNEDSTVLGVDDKWYDQNITPLGIGYDIVMLVINTKQWQEPNRARGWRTDADQGPVQLHIGCDEYERAYYPNFPPLNAFFQFSRHEIMHALYMITGQPDQTHYWWDRGLIEKARDEIVLKPLYQLPMLMKALQYLQDQLNKLMPQNTNDKITLFAEAVKAHEGWIAPNPSYPKGSRSYRNNNPGNLKFTTYIKSLGAVRADAGNFAVFNTAEDGLKALKQFIRDAGNNLLKSYKNCTIRSFFAVYAPSSDNNDPDRYAKLVATKVGVAVDTTIKSLL